MKTYFLYFVLLLISFTFYQTRANNCTDEYHNFHVCMENQHESIFNNKTSEFTSDVFMKSLNACFTGCVSPPKPYELLPKEMQRQETDAKRQNRTAECRKEAFDIVKNTWSTCKTTDFNGTSISYVSPLPPYNSPTNFYVFHVAAVLYYKNKTNSTECGCKKPSTVRTCIDALSKKYDPGQSVTYSGQCKNNFCKARKDNCSQYLVSSQCRQLRSKFASSVGSCQKSNVTLRVSCGNVRSDHLVMKNINKLERDCDKISNSSLSATNSTVNSSRTSGNM